MKKIDSTSLVVKAISGGFQGGNFAKIALDDENVNMEPNQSGH